jgi:hypothetical protein
MPRFDPVSVHVIFALNKVQLQQAFIGILWFFPVSIIPTVLHTHLHIHVALTRRAKGEAGSPPKSNALSENGEHWLEK